MGGGGTLFFCEHWHVYRAIAMKVELLFSFKGVLCVWNQ